MFKFYILKKKGSSFILDNLFDTLEEVNAHIRDDVISNYTVIYGEECAVVRNIIKIKKEIK